MPRNVFKHYLQDQTRYGIKVAGEGFTAESQRFQAELILHLQKDQLQEVFLQDEQLSPAHDQLQDRFDLKKDPSLKNRQ